VKKQIIVTGDDYGLCVSVNNAIEECLAAGTMRAACVMINMPEYAEAARLQRKFPEASIGIHWNLTQGRPILPPSKISSLVDGSGRFSGSLRRRWLTGKIDPIEVESELQAQLKRFRNVVGNPDFWNTHQDVHLSPGLFQTFVRCGVALGVRAMRCHRRFTIPSGMSQLHYHFVHPSYWAKGQVIAQWSRQAAGKGMLMPDGRLYMPGYKLDASSLQEVLTRIDWGRVPQAIELAIHPATRIEPDLFGKLTESRIREYEFFAQPQLERSLRECGVRPVGFEALVPKGNSARQGAAA
jgi:chitin disaccharide deacetylase